MSQATLYVVGSINIDHVYRLSRLPKAGETLHALDYAASLGGKGANQAIAAARAGARVHMIGAVGADGAWVCERLAAEGIAIAGIDVLEGTTGHARIEVDARGDNRIVLHAGANHRLALESVRRSLAGARRGDWLVLQNETSAVTATAALGCELGLTVVYSAAPFVPAAAASVLPHVGLLAVNAIEAMQLSAHLGREPAALGVPMTLVTAGAAGARLHARDEVLDTPAWSVTAQDSTGAGDVFLGYLVAALARGCDAPGAMREAAAAAALQVTRPGAADAIPTRAEVLSFMAAAGEHD